MPGAPNFTVAERCYAAVGDCSRALAMRRLAELRRECGGDASHSRMQAQLALLRGQFQKAEGLLVAQAGNAEAAVEMYQRTHKWDKAMEVSESVALECTH